LACKGLIGVSEVVPKEFLDWLQRRYLDTVATNLLQLNTLGRVTATLSTNGILALAIKGVVLADLGVGLDARKSSDLDLLMHPYHLEAVDKILGSLGYVCVPSSHSFHKGYVRAMYGPQVSIEVHFDLVDRTDYTMRPDIIGIWQRSTEVEIMGNTLRVPDLMDHFLVLLMQLPRHNWAPRLLADTGALVSRWGDAIDWTTLMSRAETWGIEALLGSALHVVNSELRVDLPKHVRDWIKPKSYFRRIQWHIARETFVENLAYRRRIKAGRLATVFMPDRISDVARLGRGAFSPPRNGKREGAFSNRIHSVLGALSSLPSLIEILLKSVFPTRIA